MIVPKVRSDGNTGESEFFVEKVAMEQGNVTVWCLLDRASL